MKNISIWIVIAITSCLAIIISIVISCRFNNSIIQNCNNLYLKIDSLESRIYFLENTHPIDFHLDTLVINNYITK